MAAIIVTHVILFVFLDAGERQNPKDFGFIPGAFTGTYEGHWTNWLSPFTHMLIHGGWMHMAINALMGLALCTFFERHFGTRTAVLFVLLCGLSGALIYFVLNPFTTAPVIGASGATSGLFAAVLLLLSQNGQMGQIGRKGPWPVIAIWAVLMTLIGLIGGGGIAWQAHLGGFLAGAGLTALMLKGKLKL
ncbi:MAG: rhomboid family intramembrane serine protease [Alphaproteobacteria bacterium]